MYIVQGCIRALFHLLIVQHTIQLDVFDIQYVILQVDRVIDICGPGPKGTGLQNLRECIIGENPVEITLWRLGSTALAAVVQAS